MVLTGVTTKLFLNWEDKNTTVLYILQVSRDVVSNIFCHFEGFDETSALCVHNTFSFRKNKLPCDIFFQSEGLWSETEPVPQTCQQGYRISFALATKRGGTPSLTCRAIEWLCGIKSNSYAIKKRTFISHFSVCHLFVSASTRSSSGKSITEQYIMAASVTNVCMWSEKYNVFN
jgi:hypothetical protein